MIKISNKTFGSLNGHEVLLFSVENENGYRVELSSYGAGLCGLYFPSTSMQNRVLSFSNLEDYKNNGYYLGAAAGPAAGRIKNARYEVDGVTYNLDKNEGENTLHGGKHAFHNILWKAEETPRGVKFSSSEIIDAEVIYNLNPDNSLEIIFRAKSQKSALFNPANHAYFNLGGTDIKGHYLQINAPEYLELDAQNIPTGKKLPVKNTVYDFTQTSQIGQHLEGKGIDTPFCLNSSVACTLENEERTRRVSVLTDRNALVVYTAGYFEPQWKINGRVAAPFMGIALEAQHLPDAVNHPGWGDTVIKNNVVKEYKTVFKLEEISK
ncbi:MAG: galactose mutarotase [Elusimicrobia bacterium]|nr:galactose mutarotase [Elusimicrobiota bacterium]